MKRPFRKGDKVRVKENGYEGLITFMAYVGGSWWYDIDDKYTGLAAHEIELIK